MKGNLNVNSSDYWDTYNDPTEIKSGDSELLDGYNSDFFAPLNTSLVGDFNFTGRVNFDGLWSEGGLTLEDGNIYAQTGYFYNITGLNVNELFINGSLLPQIGFTNTFNIGNATLNWKDLYLGGQVFQMELRIIIS